MTGVQAVVGRARWEAEILRSLNRWDVLTQQERSLIAGTLDALVAALADTERERDEMKERALKSFQASSQLIGSVLAGSRKQACPNCGRDDWTWRSGINGPHESCNWCAAAEPKEEKP